MKHTAAYLLYTSSTLVYSALLWCKFKHVTVLKHGYRIKVAEAKQLFLKAYVWQKMS